MPKSPRAELEFPSLRAFPSLFSYSRAKLGGRLFEELISGALSPVEFFEQEAKTPIHARKNIDRKNSRDPTNAFRHVLLLIATEDETFLIQLISSKRKTTPKGECATPTRKKAPAKEGDSLQIEKRALELERIRQGEGSRRILGIGQRTAINIDPRYIKVCIPCKGILDIQLYLPVHISTA